MDHLARPSLLRARLPIALAGLALGSCATPPPPEPKAKWDAPSADAAASSPEVAAQESGSPATCENDAQARLRTDPDGAWKMLKLCSRRWMYTDLRHLLDGPWVPQLKSRDDAALFLGELIALRGGDAEADGELLRAKGIPIYSLSQVAEHPARHANSYVLIRARVSEVLRFPGQEPKLVLTEVGRTLAAPPSSAASMTASPLSTPPPTNAAPSMTPSLPADPGSPPSAPSATDQQLAQQLATLQTIAAQGRGSGANPSPGAAAQPAAAATNPGGVDLDLQDTGLLAVGVMAKGPLPPDDDTGLLFVAKITGEERPPDVDELAAKGYERAPVVPEVTVLRMYRLGGVTMY